MGRAPIKLDESLLLDLITSGVNRKDTAAAMGITPPTLDAAIERIKRNESALLTYDKVHYLDLIAVKQKLVEGVTDEKIAEAPLGQIAMSYGVFGKMEQLIQGRPTEIHGLMGYLMQLEKEDIEAGTPKVDTSSQNRSDDSDIIDITSSIPEQLNLFE